MDNRQVIPVFLEVAGTAGGRFSFLRTAKLTQNWKR